MTLGIGSTLGVYEIGSPLGSGGMGEVYRARDTRLGREVAIKVLPEAVEREPERIARFEREARVLASLNHPHIAALYGMELAGDRHFLIMELVEGETLADRLRRGPMPVEEALRIAIQIADALEAAHEKGVVHRDLKPANVKISPEDQVKVLDFGLAKAMEPEARPGGDATHSPTLSLMATQAGMILGTAAYMSPEQAKGLPADHRSDVFSLGSVLYEMLTGRQPFQGDTAPDILASVLVREPDLSALPANLNPRLIDLLKRCLDKSPKRRWQAVGDLRAELEAIATSPRNALTSPPLIVPSKPLWRRAAAVAAIAVAFTVVGALGAWYLRPTPTSRAPIVRFSLVPPDSVSTLRSQVLAISPDGTHVAYASNGQVFLHSMTDGNDWPIPGTDLDAMAPFFSPDGQWVGFFSFDDSTLKKIAVAGGIAVTICKSEPPSGMHWYGDQILFAQSNLGIVRVSANGGVPEVIIPAKPPEAFAVPQVLNGGKDVLFSHATETGPDRWDKARVVVHSLESGAQKVVFEGGSGARYVPSGHLVYLVGGTLFALPFDLASLAVKGGPVPIVDEVRRSGAAGVGTGTGNYAFSDNGSFVYHVGAPQVRGLEAGGRRLVFVDRSGQAEALDLPAQPYYHPRVSPDGSRLAFGTDDGREAVIWIYELAGGTPPRRLTFGGRNLAPIWAPDGRRVTFQSDRDGTPEIFSQSADGSGTPERLFKGDPIVQYVPQAWHPTENILSFWSIPRGGVTGRGRVSTLRAGGNQPMPLVNDPAVGQAFSSFSPDGKWITYTSNPTVGLAASGDIFVEPFPPNGAKYQLSVDGGRESLWSPDGKQVFYRHPRSNRLIAVDVEIGGTPRFGNPVTLPVAPPIFSAPIRNFDITPDGKRFIVVLSPAAASDDASKQPERLNVVLNWFDELKAKVPTP